MPKVNIATKLAGQVTDPTAPPPPAGGGPKGTPRKATAPVRIAEAMPAGPKYLSLERKDLRVRRDQADDLTALTRQLNRARGGDGERITDNTLIRVAIDGLLRNSASLRGTTEEELLRSVTRRPPG